jgi:hypothetical protein
LKPTILISPRNGSAKVSSRVRNPVDDSLELLTLDATADRRDEKVETTEQRMLERRDLLRELRMARAAEDERERLALARQRLRGNELDLQRRRPFPADPEGTADERNVRREPEVARRRSRRRDAAFVVGRRTQGTPDPVAGRARVIALSGRIRPVGGG